MRLDFLVCTKHLDCLVLSHPCEDSFAYVVVVIAIRFTDEKIETHS